MTEFNYSIIVGIVAATAGAVASVSGFGIGSLLTPLLSQELGTKLAIVAVSIPHLLGTAQRFWPLRKEVDKSVLLSFGITSAAGGLAGALAHNWINSPSLTIIFGSILVFAGLLGASGAGEKLRFDGKIAWIAGALSGVLGGLIGNQGGIRSAALLGFELNKRAFIATATAIGLIVDCARMPIYFFSNFQQLITNWQVVVIAAIGVAIGTFAGGLLLQRIDEKLFKRIVSSIILCLGLWILIQNLSGAPTASPNS